MVSASHVRVEITWTSYFGVIRPTLQLVLEVRQLLRRQWKPVAAQVRPTHRGYIGRIVLVHQAVCILHVRRHGAIESESFGDQVAKGTRCVKGYGCTNTSISQKFMEEEEKGANSRVRQVGEE